MCAASAGGASDVLDVHSLTYIYQHVYTYAYIYIYIPP